MSEGLEIHNIQNARRNHGERIRRAIPIEQWARQEPTLKLAKDLQDELADMDARMGHLVKSGEKPVPTGDQQEYRGRRRGIQLVIDRLTRARDATRQAVDAALSFERELKDREPLIYQPPPWGDNWMDAATMEPPPWDHPIGALVAMPGTEEDAEEPESESEAAAKAAVRELLAKPHPADPEFTAQALERSGGEHGKRKADQFRKRQKAAAQPEEPQAA